MNKRVLKIDVDRHRSYNNEPVCRVTFSGEDPDGDSINIQLKGEDAQEFIRLAQALAGNESRTTDQLIRALDERRTLEAN